MPSTVTISGSCLCGSVSYRIEGEFLTAVNCHCSMCRKAHGAAFRPGALVVANAFSWEQGAALVTDYRSSEQMHRMFCSKCGSHMIGRSDAHRGILSVALGTVDQGLPCGPQQHWNVASKAGWFDITDGLPQFPVLPARR
jgi:hypothetical protein